MFDHETETLWSNLTGEPVLGPLVGQGIELRILPLVVTTWGDWRRRYPDTTVLSLETGHERDYRPGQAYGEYFASPDTMFPVGLRDDRLDTKAWVFGMRTGDSAMAFELEALQRAGIVNATVGSQSVVLVVGAGRAVRAYERRWSEIRRSAIRSRRIDAGRDRRVAVDAHRRRLVRGGWHRGILIATPRPPGVLVRLVRLLPGYRPLDGALS